MLSGKCLHSIFEERAREAPDRVALYTPERQIKYGELDSQANRLAQKLKTLGVGPEVLVGLCVDRSIEMIVGMLAILKSGGAYVPIDPAYPNKRIDFIVADSAISVVVTVSRMTECLRTCQATVVCIDDEIYSHESIPIEPGSAEYSETSLAYLIYTSGSTGSPKGVLVEHKNVTRLFDQTHHWFRFNENDVWTLFHSISFDFSVWEIWGALLYGGSLVIVPDEITRSPSQFRSLLKNRKVTVLNQTPSALRQLISAEMGCTERSDFNLRLVIIGGEALDYCMLEPWVDRYGDEFPELVNMYGITETTVHVTYKRILREDLKSVDTSVIGIPIPDLQIHLLDEMGNPVPDGTPGELYIAGPGLARGYFNNPELTDQRFTQSPNGMSGRARLYRSGDRAIRLPNGEYAYCGRSDDQIKVRGFRIEPREIELCLSGHPDLSGAVVISHDYGDGDVRLLAYIVPRPGLELNEKVTERLITESTNRAATELPLHMRPSTYFVVGEIPMTSHGKVDRESLKRMIETTPNSNGKSLGSMTTEEVVTGIWEDILRRKGVGTKDDFFDIGGTSLSLIRIFGRVNEYFNILLDVGVMAEEATIARLAQCIDSQLLNNKT